MAEGGRREGGRGGRRKEEGGGRCGPPGGASTASDCWRAASSAHAPGALPLADRTLPDSAQSWPAGRSLSAPATPTPQTHMAALATLPCPAAYHHPWILQVEFVNANPRGSPLAAHAPPPLFSGPAGQVYQRLPTRGSTVAAHAPVPPFTFRGPACEVRQMPTDVAPTQHPPPWLLWVVHQGIIHSTPASLSPSADCYRPHISTTSTLQKSVPHYQLHTTTNFTLLPTSHHYQLH